jgi:hypothetical protein
MAFKYSTGFKNAVLATSSVRDVFNGGFIVVYEASSTPESADSALPADAVELVKYSVGGDGTTGLTLDSAASNGSISKSAGEVWQGTALATGSATFFRYERDGDTGDLSATDIRIQGTVGGPASDMFMTNTTFTVDEVYTLDHFSIAVLGG